MNIRQIEKEMDMLNEANFNILDEEFLQEDFAGFFHKKNLAKMLKKHIKAGVKKVSVKRISPNDFEKIAILKSEEKEKDLRGALIGASNGLVLGPGVAAIQGVTIYFGAKILRGTLSALFKKHKLQGYAIQFLNEKDEIINMALISTRGSDITEGEIKSLFNKIIAKKKSSMVVENLEEKLDQEFSKEFKF